MAKVKQGHAHAELSVLIDARVAVDAAWVAAGIESTSHLGSLLGEIEITK